MPAVFFEVCGKVSGVETFAADPLEAAANDLIRVIDESGEDYLYPARLFRKLALPIELQRARRVAS